MNQTIYHPIYASRLETNRCRYRESLLSKIRARLRDSMNGTRAEYGKRSKPGTFIEANLLDDIMGPEIRRTLRI